MSRAAFWFAGALAFLLAAAFAVYVYSTRIDAVTTLRIGAGPRGTDLFELIEAIARLAETKTKTLKIELTETASSDENLVLLSSGKLDLAAVPADALPPAGLTLVASLYPDAFHLIASAASGITRVEDLAGKRVAVPPIGTGENRGFWMLIGQYTIPPESFVTTPMRAADAIRALRRDEVDAIFLQRPPGDRRIRWLADAKSVRLIPVDQSSALLVRKSALSVETIYKGSYAGMPPVPDTDVPTVASQRLLLARAGLQPEPVRQLTALLFDNRRDLNVLSRLASYVRQPDLNAGTLLPVHPGSIAYYDRNQPSFVQRNSDLIGIAISLAAVLGSVLLWLKNRLFAKRKNKADVYNLDLIAIAEEAGSAADAAALAPLRNKLDAMLSRMVRDLDQDKIDGDGFQYFAFTWEAVRKSLDDRERALSPRAPAGRSRTR